MIQLHQNFVKAKSVLATQICIENVRLANFLCNRKISEINLSTCFCDHQKQTMKYIIVSCLLHNKIDIENEQSDHEKKKRNVKFRISHFAKRNCFQIFFHFSLREKIFFNFFSFMKKRKKNLEIFFFACEKKRDCFFISFLNDHFENERKTIDYRFFISTAAELKKLIR